MNSRKISFRPTVLLAMTILASLVVSGCSDDSGVGPQNDQSIVTMIITATVTSVTDDANLLGGAIEAGDLIEGAYTYDMDTADTNPLTTVGDYRHDSAPCGITLMCEGYEFETDPADVDFLVELVNDHPTPARDHYLLRSYKNLPAGADISVSHILWQLDDDTATALSSIELTGEPPVLSDWPSSLGLVIDGFQTSNSSNTFRIRGQVTDISNFG
ncbi:MAG TPA: hypothetical protein VLA34_07850 [Candidatus Krumholzibacterium sp.]|nr:hypothetical protein [Candidatus Krumholzibacterium sp.]